MKIQINKITEMDSIVPILDLMKNIWQLHDREVVAPFEMKAVSQFGLLLGAYDLEKDDSLPIGFIYAFNKFPNIHYSHMMGIDPKYQNKNIGFLLKEYHRKIAIQSENPKINSIEWTVDPLLANNANLNFRKLGVVCNQYYEDFYGIPTNVGIYPALPTDRILVSWNIHSERVSKHFDQGYKEKHPWKKIEDLTQSIPLITPGIWENNLLCPLELNTHLNITQELYSLEIPNNFTDLSRKNYDWALSWRLSMRMISQTFFKKNYYLVDFKSFIDETHGRRNFYIFSRNANDYKY
jgi:predicted GNAT superfamily acetyltransferase